MTDPTRGARLRRGSRRPGWFLMTVLLVLAIGASSALVFTNRVELLKLAVVLALWAAVVAAFVSVIYRRQSDSDQAKVRDLKLVYDLQLDREISARREYELAVETQLRRELASELRAQSAEEVSALRAELAALRANLEFLFDADLSHRHAIETDRSSPRAYGEWAADAETAGRVSLSRIDTEDAEEVFDDEAHVTDTAESPIIDVPAEPHPPEVAPPSPAEVGGAHRRFAEDARTTEQRAEESAGRRPPPPPPSAPRPGPEPQYPWLPPPTPQAARSESQTPEPAAQTNAQWEPAPADGEWIPPGEPGSHWASSPGGGDTPEEYVGRRRASEAPAAEPDAPDDGEGGAHTGGQSVAELLARLQATPSGGGRRRRRAD
ncbi:MAG: hypothetical protein K0U78_08235 [Actinomycetia bacterium]|nr:hypothetical protein [Actinomycetes bacterium]